MIAGSFEFVEVSAQKASIVGYASAPSSLKISDPLSSISDFYRNYRSAWTWVS